MSQFVYLWQQMTRNVSGLAASVTWRNVLDIVIVAMVIYYVIKLIKQTRANSVFKGLGILLVMTWLSEVVQLNTINWMLLQVVNAGALMLVVLFQPELRRGLEQIGRSKLYANVFSGARRTRSAQHDAQELVKALTALSRRKVGALVVIEQKTGMDDIASSGTRIDAEISSALIENIFEPNTPLHDGAVLIHNGRIHSAACYLPLSENSSISRELGTRHRAALGISETTDAVVLIASEETGILSVAREGRLTRYLDAKTLNALLMEIFDPEAPMVQRALSSRARSAVARKEASNEKREP